MSVGLHAKCRFFLSGFNEHRIFSTDFRKNTKISDFMKIRPVGAELFYADRRTDMTKRIVVVRKFANAPKTRRFVNRCFRNVAVFLKEVIKVGQEKRSLCQWLSDSNSNIMLTVGARQLEIRLMFSDENHVNISLFFLICAFVRIERYEWIPAVSVCLSVSFLVLPVFSSDYVTL